MFNALRKLIESVRTEFALVPDDRMQCPECGHYRHTFEEWDDAFCSRCGWNETDSYVAQLRAIGDHATADYIEFGTPHPDDPTYCDCGAHVSSTPCYFPANR